MALASSEIRIMVRPHPPVAMTLFLVALIATPCLIATGVDLHRTWITVIAVALLVVSVVFALRSQPDKPGSGDALPG